MFIEQIISSHKKVVLFGAVESVFMKALVKSGLRIERILDNNYQLHNTRIEDINVCPVDSISDYNPDDTLIIVMSLRHSADMITQLNNLGFHDCVIAESDIDDFKDNKILFEINGINCDEPSPQILNIELSGVCNLRCVYCPFHGALNKKMHKKLMEWEVLKQVVEQARSISTINTLSVVGNGELFLHPEWFEMTSYILNELDIKKLMLYTNGMLMEEGTVDKLNRIRKVDDIYLEVSIDGRTPEECERYRNGVSYRVIKQNLQRAISMLDERYRVSIFNLYSVSETFIEESEYLLDFANEPPQFLKDDFPGIKIVSRKPVLDGDEEGSVKGFKKILVRKKPPYTNCINSLNRMAIDSQGNIVRCSCSKGFDQVIGNVGDGNILELWRNDAEMNLARTHLISNNMEKDFCSGCELKSKEPYYVLVEANE